MDSSDLRILRHGSSGHHARVLAVEAGESHQVAIGARDVQSLLQLGRNLHPLLETGGEDQAAAPGETRGKRDPATLV